ncbi:dual specificity testis-specific protein kinase 1 [Pogoniulus pusillus]|uniref:dual specificity testis-specific protein kinase 1 n=1 Tax=Pogoniulus pusillus TaxID=488313 RepID=UPI0030B94075
MERKMLLPDSLWEDEEGESGPSTGSERPRPSSYRALRSAVSTLARMDDFYCEKIGSGFFSDVLKVRHRQTGQVMVLKLNRVESNRGNMLQEVQMMNRLSHPNILRFMGACVHQGQLHALVEYINGGTLEQLLDSSVALPWSTRIKLALDIAYGMHYLHSKDFFHRDLTSKNCLVRHETTGYTAVVGDFGLAEKIPISRKESLPVVGSPYWMAPEVLRAEFYNETADLFSYGIVLCEIIARIPADPDYMPRTEEYGLDVNTFRSMVEISCPMAFLELALNCCNMEPTLRPLFIDITRCLEDVLQEQRCAEGDITMPSDVGESSLKPGTTATLSGVAKTASDLAKCSLLRELGTQHQQPDQSLSHSQSESSVLQPHTLTEPRSGAKTKEASPRVNPFSHREDLKGGKIKLFTPSKSPVSLSFNLPCTDTLPLSAFVTPRPAIKKQCDSSGPATTLKCSSLPPTLKLSHQERQALDVGSPCPTDDPQTPSLPHSATLSTGEEDWLESSSGCFELPQSSTPRPGTLRRAFSGTQQGKTDVVPSTPLEGLPELSSTTVTMEHIVPALELSESSSSALEPHEVLPGSGHHGPALRPSSQQSCLCHHQKVPGPAEPKPKSPEGKS